MVAVINDLSLDFRPYMPNIRGHVIPSVQILIRIVNIAERVYNVRVS